MGAGVEAGAASSLGAMESPAMSHIDRDKRRHRIHAVHHPPHDQPTGVDIMSAL